VTRCVPASVYVLLGEWISGAVCGYIVNYLLENYGNNEDLSIAYQIYLLQFSYLCYRLVTKLLDLVEFIFIPFVNLDGYAVSYY